MSGSREIRNRYEDPLDVLWLATAGRLGMTVVRSAEVFASWDGNGVLTIGTPETLDPDDCLAQMILHEACHALVEGPESLRERDWGVHLDRPGQRSHEHACLRLQAALTTPHGLRSLLAPTTDFRAYFDALPDDPLDGDDEAVPMARRGLQNAKTMGWRSILDDALTTTARMAALVREHAESDSLWSRAEDGLRAE